MFLALFSGILVHLIGFHDLIGHMLSGDTLGDAAHDQHHLHTGVPPTTPHGLGEGSEDAPHSAQR